LIKKKPPLLASLPSRSRKRITQPSLQDNSFSWSKIEDLPNHNAKLKDTMFLSF